MIRQCMALLLVSAMLGLCSPVFARRFCFATICCAGKDFRPAFQPADFRSKSRTPR
jgi:hypothetical protein